MPSRNLEKVYLADSYYHIYNRGTNKQAVYLDDDDYAVFLNLLKRYLDDTPAKDAKGRQYEWLHNDLELIAFCLMPNHFHALIYQHQINTMTRLMRGVGTSYTTYFNKKHKRSGPLFHNRFSASLITNESYLQHISRYIHLNPNDYVSWPFSSLPYFLGTKQAGWVKPQRILEIFDNNRIGYKVFLEDYKEQKAILEDLKHELADQ